MINTISLSTDHRYIYLIDKSNCSKFRIDKGKGALVSTLRHQLTVACALDVPKEGVEQKITLNKKDRQWQFFFVPGTESLTIIGTSDIQGGLQEEGSIQIIGTSDIQGGLKEDDVEDEDDDIEVIGSSDIHGSATAEKEFKTRTTSRSVSPTDRNQIIGTSDIQGGRHQAIDPNKKVAKTSRGTIRELATRKATTVKKTNIPARVQEEEKPIITYKVRLEGRIIHIYTNKAGNIEVRSMMTHVRS